MLNLKKSKLCNAEISRCFNSVVRDISISINFTPCLRTTVQCECRERATAADCRAEGGGSALALHRCSSRNLPGGPGPEIQQHPKPAGPFEPFVHPSRTKEPPASLRKLTAPKRTGLTCAPPGKRGGTSDPQRS
ncbi:hypothetical protein AMECASPLE_016348 [Ameca splendens]|uniref:Uncharacterized protein n=1 Tax=Ameca splendens TaxID=208324 RepID=A0ABV0XR35_9TELE